MTKPKRRRSNVPLHMKVRWSVATFYHRVVHREIPTIAPWYILLVVNLRRMMNRI